MGEPAAAKPPPFGGVFIPRTQVLAADDVARATTRIAHEIVERNRGVRGVVVIGLQRGGAWWSQRLVEALARIEPDSGVVGGTLDVAFHRDDHGLRPVVPGAVTSIPVDLTDRIVVLVDDVLCTGRTVRAALDALHEHGRPRAVQLAVMVDQGHRELPIRTDYVGKNLPTRADEMVSVRPEGVWIGEDR